MLLDFFDKKINDMTTRTDSIESEVQGLRDQGRLIASSVKEEVSQGIKQVILEEFDKVDVTVRDAIKTLENEYRKRMIRTLSLGFLSGIIFIAVLGVVCAGVLYYQYPRIIKNAIENKLDQPETYESVIPVLTEGMMTLVEKNKVQPILEQLRSQLTEELTNFREDNQDSRMEFQEQSKRMAEEILLLQKYHEMLVVEKDAIYLGTREDLDRLKGLQERVRASQ